MSLAEKKSLPTTTELRRLERAARADLADARFLIRGWIVVDGIARLLLAAFLIVVVDFMLDYQFEFDQAGRATILVLCAATLAWNFYRFLLKPLSRRLTDGALCESAKRIDRGAMTRLHVALQLADESLAGVKPQSELARLAIAEGLAVSRAPLRRLIDTRGLTMRFAILGATLAASAVGTKWLSDHKLGQTWLRRNVFLHDDLWPRKTILIVEDLKEGSLLVARGSDLRVRVRVAKESKLIPQFITLDFGTNRARLRINSTGEREFETTIAAVVSPFQFRVIGGDATTKPIQVLVVEPPALRDLIVSEQRPLYAGSGVFPINSGSGAYYVLEGSALVLEANSIGPIAKATLSWSEGEAGFSLTQLPDSEGVASNHLKLQLPSELTKPGVYTISLEGTNGARSDSAATFRIEHRADRPPKAKLTLEKVGGLVAATAKIPWRGEVTDDWGIAGVTLLVGVRTPDRDEPPRQHTFEYPLPSSESPVRVEPSGVLEVSSLGAVVGQSISSLLEATDRNDVTGPGRSRSLETALRVVSEDELRKDWLRRERELRQELERLRKLLEDLQTDTKALIAGRNIESANDARQREFVEKARQSLSQIIRRHRSLTAGVGTVLDRFTKIHSEVVANCVEPEEGPLARRIEEKILSPMRRLVTDVMGTTGSQFDEMRGQLGTAEEPAASEAVLDGSKAELELIQTILAEMSSAEGFQEAINLLQEVQKAQQEVLERTNKAMREREKNLFDQSKESEKPPSGP